MLASGLFPCSKVINTTPTNPTSHLELSAEKTKNSFELHKFTTIKLYEQHGMFF